MAARPQVAPVVSGWSVGPGLPAPAPPSLLVLGAPSTALSPPLSCWEPSSASPRGAQTPGVGPALPEPCPGVLSAPRGPGPPRPQSRAGSECVSSAQASGGMRRTAGGRGSCAVQILDQGRAQTRAVDAWPAAGQRLGEVGDSRGSLENPNVQTGTGRTQDETEVDARALSLAAQGAAPCPTASLPAAPAGVWDLTWGHQGASVGEVAWEGRVDTGPDSGDARAQPCLSRLQVTWWLKQPVASPRRTA